MNLRKNSVYFICMGGVAVLTACDNSAEKIKEIDNIKAQTKKMQEEMQEWNQQMTAITIIPNFQELDAQYNQDIQVRESEIKEFDGLIQALSLRKEALHKKLEEFKMSHPID